MTATHPPADILNPHGTTWLAFDLRTNEQDAIARYRQRIGKEPQTVVRDNCFLWLGPVPEPEQTRATNTPRP